MRVATLVPCFIATLLPSSAFRQFQHELRISLAKKAGFVKFWAVNQLCGYARRADRSWINGYRCNNNVSCNGHVTSIFGRCSSVGGCYTRFPASVRVILLFPIVCVIPLLIAAEWNSSNRCTPRIRADVLLSGFPPVRSRASTRWTQPLSIAQRCSYRCSLVRVTLFRLSRPLS